MNKNAIKSYAVWARNELRERVGKKMDQYEIHPDGDPNSDRVRGILLTETEKNQRQKVLARVKEEGMDQVTEEVAYTWFNRFCALRYMEVNNFLPSRIRVFTDEKNAFKPQILTEAVHLELDGLDREKVFELKEKNDEEELFKYLFITQCNALSDILPGMFQKIADDSELLFPDHLLRDGSVIGRMIKMIPAEDWLAQVQIIGWLYQYYNSEPKDKVFADLKKNIKITKEKIPAATQLFTPDWIVRYMVENSLGRLWVEGHPDTKSQFLPSKEERENYAAGNRENPEGKWYYFLEEAPQEPEAQKQLAEICKEYAALTLEEILCIDPCAGSGHILCYQFDVLFQIYQSCGYTAREAVAGIIEKNLWGLDIDDRAAQLAYFAVMMKARKYDSRFLSRKDENGKPKIPQPHVYPIVESNEIGKDALDYFCARRPELTTAMETIVKELHDAKEYGSILTVTPQDWGLLYARLEEVEQDISMHKNAVLEQIKPLVQVAQPLAQKYHAVVTNPPYMGSSGQCVVLSEYVKKHYPDSKSDLFAVFMERCGEFTRKNGYQSMITQHSWMFLSSFEKLRQKLLLTDTVNMAHLGARAFEEIGGEVVQTTSFVLRKSHIEDYQGVYCRLIEPTTQDEKEEMFLSGANRYTAKQSNFSKIPGSPVAYWVSDALLEDFGRGQVLKKFGDTRQGMATSDNNRFLRLWYEVSYNKLGLSCVNAEDALRISKKWYPYNKGGDYRKWYGNIDYTVNYENDGFEVKAYAALLYKSPSRTIKSISEYFKPCLSWSKISSGSIAFRYYPQGFVFDVAGCSIFYVNEETMYYDFGFINSKIAKVMLAIISPTLNYEAGHIASLPVIRDDKYSMRVTKLTRRNVKISKSDWDSFETSWEFTRHPLLPPRGQTAAEQKTEKEAL